MKLLYRPAFLLGLLVSGAALAADTLDSPRQYDIELLVFRNLVAGDGGEVWPPDVSDWYEETPVAETAPLNVQWLPESSYHLKAERAALNRSSRYRTLAYLAWRQPVLDRTDARALELPARPRSNAAWVDGTVKVAVERYLHLYLDLQLHLPQTAAATAASDTFADGVEPPKPEIRLTEQRRMRSKEVHYFDNPRFGVIALITPYEPPVEVPAEVPAESPVETPTEASPAPQ
jgi:hypothetical protein